MSCFSCKRIIERLELLKCSGCQEKYHYGCLNITSAVFREQSDQLRRTFKCESCLNVTRRTKVADDTPIRGDIAAENCAKAAERNIIELQEDENPSQGPERSSLIGSRLQVNTALTNTGGMLDMSVFINMINEAVATKINILETRLVKEIKEAVTSSSERENINLKAKLKEANEYSLLLQAEIRDLKAKMETQSAAYKGQKQTAKNKGQLSGSKTEAVAMSSENLLVISPAAAVAPPAAAVTPPAAAVVPPAVAVTEPAPTQPKSSYAAVANKVASVTLNKEQQVTTEVGSNWIEVNRNKQVKVLNPVIKGGNSSNLQIKAVERKKHLHLWRLLPETTTDDLTQYIQSVLGKESYVKVDKINHKTERGYASFRVCVSESNFDQLCNPDIWPSNAEFSEWVWFRGPTANTNNKPESQAN